MNGFRPLQLLQNIDLGPDMLFKDLHIGHCHAPSCTAMSASGDRLCEGLRLRDGLGEVWQGGDRIQTRGDGRTPELFDAISGAPALFDVVVGHGIVEDRALQLVIAVGCCVVEDGEDTGTSGHRNVGKPGCKCKGDLERDRKPKAT